MTRIRSGAVQVEGLAELSRALKKLEGGKELSRELREANKDAATYVKDKASGRGRSLGSTAAMIAPMLKASAGAQSAGVSLGSHPAAAGAEFGGRGRPTTQQFQPHRGRDGYFVYPTIRDSAEEIVKPYEEAIDRLIKKAGLA